MSKYDDFITVTGYGTPGGLGGVNCRHSFFFVSETQPRNYTREQLEKMSEAESTKKEYDGKSYTNYEASQKMRVMENNMRKTRTKAAAFKAAESIDNYKTQKIIYAAQMKKYKEFAKTFGLKTQFERVYADGIGRL